MAIKTYHIELRCPVGDDEAQFAALKEAVRINARNLFGAALLVLGGDTPPTIAAYSEDFMTGQDEITIDLKEEEHNDD